MQEEYYHHLAKKIDKLQKDLEEKKMQRALNQTRTAATGAGNAMPNAPNPTIVPSVRPLQQSKCLAKYC